MTVKFLGNHKNFDRGWPLGYPKFISLFSILFIFFSFLFSSCAQNEIDRGFEKKTKMDCTKTTIQAFSIARLDLKYAFKRVPIPSEKTHTHNYPVVENAIIICHAFMIDRSYYSQLLPLLSAKHHPPTYL